jgi:hypothetical protein
MPCNCHHFFFFIPLWITFVLSTSISSRLFSSSSSLNDNCLGDDSNYGVSTPNYAIAPAANMREIKKLIGDHNLTRYYEEGRQRCAKTIENPTKLIPIERQFFRQFGIIFVSFGPMTSCSIHSQCWFGVLSCGSGEFKSNALIPEYGSEIRKRRFRGIHMESSPYLPDQPIPKFLGWSMQSLHFQFRVVGSEIIFPQVLYLRSKNILFCSFTLTLPGSYRIEMIPREFYPGVLFNYTKNEMVEGYHLLGYKALLTTPAPQIISFPMEISLKKNNCQFNKKLSNQHLELPTPLPFCLNGNHTGRYLTIPIESLHICRAEKFISMIKPLQRQHPPHDILASAIEREFIAMDHTKHDQELRRYFIDQYQHNASLSTHSRLHFKELLRHTDEKSSLCSIVVVNNFHMVPGLIDTRHEIFAPYQCRYKFYSPQQVWSVFT